MAEPKRTLGNYELLEELGRGGMGVVYLARHRVLGKEVALKVILEDTSAEAAARFTREANTLAQLDHPNLVRVLDANLHEGRPFLVMELLPGETLQQRIKLAGPLPPDEAAEVIRAVALGVEAAHEVGILHRDVKPENVVMCSDGRPVLTDFGLASAVSAKERLTQTGQVLGTPSYMSPEQANGDSRTLGPAADVYSLGATLYALLVGRAPFEGQHPYAVIAALLIEPPVAPRELRAEVPPELEAICLRCLEKDPADRYPSAAALAEDLERCMRRDAGEAPPPRSPWALGAALAVGGLVALGLATWFVLRERPSPPPPPATAGARPDNAPARATTVPGEAVPADRVDAPAWYLQEATDRRARLPLPPGLGFGDVPGEYVWRKDGSVLVWVPKPVGMVSLPERRLAPARGYFLGKYEVTERQFREYCAASGARRSAYTAGEWHPVRGISWVEASAYCAWAGLRLPTAAEWWYGATSGDGRAFPWGEASEPGLRANTRENVGRDAYTGTSPVGSFPEGASPFGCHDMAGNVFEWLADPKRHQGQACRMVVGAGWDNPLSNAKVGLWWPDPETRRTWHTGFRVALSVN